MDGSSDMGEFGFFFDDISNNINFDVSFVDVSGIDISSNVFDFFLNFNGLLSRFIFLCFQKSFIIRELRSNKFLISISVS